MLNFFITEGAGKAIPILPIVQDDFANWQTAQPTRIKNLVANNNFLAKPGTFCLLTDGDGNLEQVLLGLAKQDDFFSFGVLPKVLPSGCYEIGAPNFSLAQLQHVAIGWGLGNYQFKQYKTVKEFSAKLLCQEAYDIPWINQVITAIFMVRDLINTPAGELYPEKLAEVATNLAGEFKAEVKIIRDQELATNFPAVYAVGRGSERKPVLIDLHYGDPKDPKVVLVGKGVCFDSGGLQLKPSSGMLLMKKDMAGAAHVLGLARMIMSAKLPINLRVIIPAVENLPSGGSLKPGDIIKTRQGLTMEIMNTDAEGRIILADALTYVAEWQPKLILDFATLTGAARVALGPDIVALFTNNDQVAQEVTAAMVEEEEPVWRLPLYQPYFEFLKSEIADLKNIATSDNAGAGAILGALILQQFVVPDMAWAHFDMNAYNSSSKPGKPEGGEACCLRGVFKYLAKKFPG